MRLNESFPRELHLEKLKSSAFVFGPRMTGKTTLLTGLSATATFNLLDVDLELKYRQSPGFFWEEISALPSKSLVIIDEIQKIPLLLNYVQMGMEKLKLKFILSGSSARKLKRGGANLLGGRALDLKLHPLTVEEIGSSFKMDLALKYGTLPKIYQLLVEKEEKEAGRFLRSYITTYIKEEIQLEAITRNLAAFQRFLSVAGQGNAQIIEFANISRECSVPMSTVKEYYQILEDTLLGEFLWPYDRSERKKARPKFYFFDCGVIRALQNRLLDPPTPQEKGFLFETWLCRELVRIRDYEEKGHSSGLWRKGNHEIDILISGGHGPLLAIECKSSRAGLDTATVRAFRDEFPKVPLWVASLTDEHSRKLESGVEVHSWRKIVQSYRAL